MKLRSGDGEGKILTARGVKVRLHICKTVTGSCRPTSNRRRISQNADFSRRESRMNSGWYVKKKLTAIIR
jgi:hypothetical protein